jgi:hypothetical protein
MKPRADAGFQASDDVEQRLASQKGGGSPLPDDTRSFMEARLGADFGGVRTHTGGEALQLTRELKAQAFTHGQDIYFGAGKYDPDTSGGQRLLAHELTHVVQQTGDRGRGVIQRVHYLHLRQRGADYEEEQTKQRPSLKNVIRGRANLLKQKYLTYKNLLKQSRTMSIAQALIDKAKNVYENQLKFIRKQEISEAAISDQGDFDASALAGRLVEYDDPTKQAETQVEVSGGKLKRADGDWVDTTDSVTFQEGLGWEIFVMSETGDIHLASHRIGKYHHSSLLAGADVASAGMMEVKAGKITKLSNHSGHYMPEQKHVHNVLQRLAKKGIDLNFDLQIHGGFSGTALKWWTQVGEKRYEKFKALQVWDRFVEKHGEKKVLKKWQVTQVPPASEPDPYKRKLECKMPSGADASYKEIRAFLKLHFGWKKPGFLDWVKAIFTWKRPKKKKVPIGPEVTEG